MNLRIIALLAATLPFFAVHLTWLVAASYGLVEWCNPYIDSCTSISATGRHAPASYVFRATMLPAAVVLALYWWCNYSWLRWLQPAAAPLRSLHWMLVLGLLTHSIWALVLSGLVSAVVWTVLGHTALEGPNNHLRWDRSALTELIVFGRWILLSSMVGVLAMYGDRIWFGASMSAAQLGVYSIAALILGAVQTALMKIVGAVALPAFSEAARADDKPRLKALYFRFRLLVDLLVLFICGGFLTASPLLIGWMYDDRYREAGPMLAILSLSFIVLRYTLAHQVWIALGLTKYQAMDNIIRLVSLWGLLPLLLAIGGVEWAIWGVALHAVPTLVLVVYVNCKLDIFSLKRELVVLPMLLVGALCGALLTAFFNWL